MRRSPVAACAPTLHLSEKLNGLSYDTRRTVAFSASRNFNDSASWLFVTSTISRSGYFVACGNSWRQAWARLGESVGTMIETRGHGSIFSRARFAVGYSRISAGKFLRRLASVCVLRLVRLAFRFPHGDPGAGSSR